MTTQYLLEPTIDQYIIDFTRINNGVTWKGVLTTDQYVKRDYELSLSSLCQPGIREGKPYYGMVNYVFRDLSISEEGVVDKKTFNIVSSCELLIRKSWRISYQDGETVVDEVPSGCIGAVFTIPKYRGRGIAGKMVNELNKWSVENLQHPLAYNFLYSDVGEYYVRCGYKSHGVDLIKVPLDSEPVGSGKYDAKYVEYQQFEPLMQLSAKKTLQQMKEETVGDKKTRVSLIPDARILDWFHYRSILLGKMTADNSPSIYGVTLEEDGVALGYVCWFYDWSEDEVIILQLEVFDENKKIDLLCQLIDETYRYLHQNYVSFGFKQIKIWDSSLETEVKEQVLGHLRHKYVGTIDGIENSSRSAIYMFDGTNETTEWVNNNKWGWF